MTWIDSLVNLILNFIPLRLVRANEQGVLEVFGKYKRTVGPGLYFHCKFVREIDSEVVTEQGIDCPNQLLTSKDDVRVTVSCNVTYIVDDAGTKHLNAHDADRLLGLEAMRYVARVIRRYDYATIQSNQNALERQLRRRLRKRAEGWGVRLTDAGFTHFAKMPLPIHLLNDQSFKYKED